MKLVQSFCVVALLLISVCVNSAMAEGDASGIEDALVGKVWLARSIGKTAAVPGVHSTLLFAADGTMSGSGGCNRLNASWQLSGVELSFGPVAATQMMCLGDRMGQESAFLGAVQKGGRVEMSGDALLLRAKSGNTIRFVESKPAKLTGAVSYRERMALPKDAVITVRLLDVSKMDVAAAVLANQVITPETQFPIPFSLDYESAEIDERMTYAVDAEIRVGQRLMFRSSEQRPVLARGAPRDEVEIEVERVR